MQYFYFLLLMAMCQGQAASKTNNEPVLPKPKLLDLVALTPTSLQVEWELVDDVPGLDPIKGYKILVWELHPVNVSEIESVNGVQKLVPRFRSPKLSYPSGILPEIDAEKVVVSDPRINKAEVPNVKPQTIYEVRVRAFTESEDGPLSTHLSIQIWE